MSELNVEVLTIFPELFPGPLGVSVIGAALKKKQWQLSVNNIRDFAFDKHRSIDDYPAGGGAGMVFKPDVLSAAIEHAKQKFNGQPAKIIYFSPRGKLLNQRVAASLLQLHNLILICARFEGVDQRVLDCHNVEELSIGDYVLAGGETAAFTLIEACVRLMPGALGADASTQEESFAIGTDYEHLLEYDQYTKPAQWNGLPIPDVLLSGNHARIREWLLQNARARTEKYRPELLEIKRSKRP
jgi:tRNA (guanine37-N1)-methyltransferase